MRRGWLVVVTVFAAACTIFAPGVYGRPLSFNLAAGDTLRYLAGNSVVDIEYDTIGGEPQLWVGTGGGASVSTDFGVTWRTFTTEQGLSANSVSALHIQNQSVVWLGMAHSQDFDGDFFPVGDGFNFTGDGGNTWDTAAPDQSTGKGFFTTQAFGMLPFDLASEPTGVWAATFFGGLIRSTDSGVTWFNVFPSAVAQTDFANRSFADLGNRFFAVAGGPLNAVGDTIEVYAGSAGGINRFLLIDAKLKLSGAPVWSIHSDPNGSYDWLATGGGVSRIDQATSTTVFSYFDSTATGQFPAGMFLSSASPIRIGDPTLVVSGAFDTSGTDTVGLGLVRTTDQGDTWELLDSAWFVGAGMGAYDLMFTANALYAAAGDSGLWRSFDFGTNWEKLYVNPADQSPASAQNRVYSLVLDPPARQIYVGTRNGIYRLGLDAADNIVSTEAALYEGDLVKAPVIRRLRAFREGGGDLLLWAAAHRDDTSTTQRNTSLFSNDSGATWQEIKVDLVPWDFALLNDTVFAATNGGLLIAELDSDSVLNDTVVPVFRLPDSLEFEPGFRTIKAMGDTLLWLGGSSGFARRVGAGPTPGNFNWDIRPFVPRDSVDFITRSSYDGNSDSSISGDFVIALDIQRHLGEKTIWASSRLTDGPQFNAVSRSTDEGRTWAVFLDGKIAWNISSFEENVWAATNDGLYHTTNAGQTWDRLPIVDLTNNTEFYEGTEILSVRQIDDTTVFAGSEDGFARSTDLGATWTITRSFVGIGTEAAGGSDASVYASPVPYSPARGSRLRIHYQPQQTGPVRIEVFDFAMQKVATILDGEQRAGTPGADPFGTNHLTEEWNATNDNGDRVATGVYFFRVEMSGDVQWGKLVILP